MVAAAVVLAEQERGRQDDWLKYYALLQPSQVSIVPEMLNVIETYNERSDQDQGQEKER